MLKNKAFLGAITGIVLGVSIFIPEVAISLMVIGIIYGGLIGYDAYRNR